MACLPTKILIEFGRYQIISISVSTARLITAFLILCYAYLYPLKWEKFSFNDERQYGNAKWLWRENSARMSATDGTATSNPRLASVQLMSTDQLPLLLMLPTLTD